MLLRLRKTTSRYIAVVWTLGIFLATLMPAQHVPSTGIDWPADKVVHFLMFAGFGLFWMRGLYLRLQKRLRWVILSGIVVAILTELLQAAMGAGRQANIGDIIANIAGLLTAVFLFKIWFKRTQPA